MTTTGIQLRDWQVLVVDRGWSPREYVERELVALYSEVVLPVRATNGPRA
jgi:hypothetical protein